METGQVADLLEEIAALLEIRGDNPFRARAYLNAARTLRSLGRSVAELVGSGELPRLKGIGPSLSESIATLTRTGRLPYLEELRASVPPALLEILAIPGLGPRKARALIERLEVSSLGELEYACHENRVSRLEGFGARSQEKILEGIRRVKAYRGRFLLGEALGQAEEIEAAVGPLPDVRRTCAAGALRRRVETVQEIVLVAASPAPDHSAAAFIRLPQIASVRSRDGRWVEASLASGIPVRLRLVAEDRFGAALLSETGSAEHLAALRDRARGAGLRLREDGLERGDGALPAPDEEAIYRALGLPVIPPELREGRGEIEAAAAGSLPDLVADRDLRGILHVHSTWSDGRLSVEEIVRRCAGLQCEYVGITDHSQSARYARGLTPESLRRQQEEIDGVREAFPRIRVLKGSEVDILPDGSLDYPDEVLRGLDFTVVSVHSAFRLTRAEQTRRITTALRNPRATILGHPTGRLLLARDAYDVDLEEVLRVAAAEGVYLELNAHPRRLDLDSAACRRARSLGARFAIDPDAHDAAGLTDTRFGVAVARRAGLEAADILNTLPAARLPDALARRA
ncbi:MAG: DNA polymerase/3'-5' exonuclease PolX [Acidobacteriota bacterium]